MVDENSVIMKEGSAIEVEVSPEDREVIAVLEKAELRVSIGEKNIIEIFSHNAGSTVEYGFVSAIDIAGATINQMITALVKQSDALDEAEKILRKQGRW